MDLEGAVQSHVAWKVKLRVAIAQKEKVDALTLASPHDCELGKWLRGEGLTRFGSSPEFHGLARCHAEFHAAAAQVAALVNDARYAEAQAALAGDTPYARASAEVAKAVLAMRQRSG